MNGTIPLSKTTKFIVDNRGRTAPTAEYGIPLIATNCISNDRLYPAYEKLRFVSKETYETWFRSHPVRLGLTKDEKAFYDALAANDSAVQAMGVPELKVIAAELVTKVRQSVTIDWQHREGARAKIRVIVKRILNYYGYPPDLQDAAVQTVLMQAELLCVDWV
jgi:type I restriction enzyme R subunit